VEKILKSSYCDDEEMCELIVRLKEEARKEKTAWLTKHVADIYRYRTGTSAHNLSQAAGTEEMAGGDSEMSASVSTQEGGGGDDDVKTEDTGMMNESDFLRSCRQQSAILEGANDVQISDSEDASISQTVEFIQACMEKLRCKPENYAEQVGDIRTQLERHLSDLFNSATSQSGSLQSKLANIPQVQMKFKRLLLDKFWKDMGNLPEEDRKILADLREEFERAFKHVVTSECEGATGVAGSNLQREGVNTSIMSLNHRTLCITVCMKLKTRMLLIKQEVHKKWLAYKLQCDENVSEIELLQKVQQQLKDTAAGDSEPWAVAFDVDKGCGEARNSSTLECVQELQSLVEKRGSPEAQADSVNDHIESAGIVQEADCGMVDDGEADKPSQPADEPLEAVVDADEASLSMTVDKAPADEAAAMHVDQPLGRSG